MIRAETVGSLAKALRVESTLMSSDVFAFGGRIVMSIPLC